MNAALQFDEESHTYRYSGQVVPSVTQILKPVSPDFTFVPSEKLERARLLGNAVDAAICLFEKKQLDESSLAPVIRSYLDAWIEFKSMSGWETIDTQERVYSEKYGYAGTLDLRGIINNQIAVLDIKRTLVIPAHAGPQTAAYAAATVADVRYALHLKPLNVARRWVLERLDSTNDWIVFMSCLTIFRFKEKHKC